MKHALLIIMLAIFAGQSDASEKLIISTGTDIARELTAARSSAKFLHQFEGRTILKINEKELPKITEIVHKAGRCGGFLIHKTLREAKTAVAHKNKTVLTYNYKVKSIPLAANLVKEIREPQILKMIQKLSSFHNRYYTSKTGIAAAEYIKSEWSKYASTVLFKHKSLPQSSVIATIPGTTKADEIIIIGGHLDSINGFLFPARKKAPGADDNASGIATVTEVLRVLSEAKYNPKRTLMFIGYAAEEVGLRGSSAIAKRFRREAKKIRGVMQLDMDNYNGSKKKIFLTTDYTNKPLTDFTAKLIDTYVKVPYGFTSCGYACSDHASWTAAGYPSVFPFEASKKEMNKDLHTVRDTLAKSNGTAEHAANFAKLGVAFMLEMDLQ